MFRIAVLLLPLALGACSRAGEAPPAPPPPQVSVVTVQPQAVPVTIEPSGRTSALGAHVGKLQKMIAPTL